MTFFTHPEPCPLRELQTDWVLPPSATEPHALEQKQRLLELPAHRLITDIPTRWNSAFDMVECFLERLRWLNVSSSNSQQLGLLLSLGMREKEKDSSTFTELDVSNAKEFIQALKPIEVATRVMSEETHPTLSVKAPLHVQFLWGTRETLRNSPFIIELKEAIHHTCYPWFPPDLLRYDCTASVLHPAPSGHSHWIRSKV